MKSKKSKKSKRILACAISAALIISAASVSLSAFAAYDDYSYVPGYSDNGTTDDKNDDYVQRTLIFDESEFESVSSEKILCTDPAMLEDDYAVEIKIPEDYIPTPESEEYEFTGWRCLQNDEIYQPGDTVSVTSGIGESDCYLSSKWKYVGKKTLVAWYYDGMQRNELKTIENIAPDTKSVTITAPPALTNSANTFKGWEVYVGDKYVTVQPGEEVEITGIDEYIYEYMTVDFSALWEKNTLAFEQERSISMYLPGDKYDEDSQQFEGTELYVKYFDKASQTVKGTYDMETGVTTYETSLELKAPSAAQLPKKEGYTFKEWCKNPFGYGETYKPGDVIDTTDEWTPLYAIYTKDTSTYTVKTGYYDGDNWFMSKTEEVADDAASYDIEAPAALKNETNTFLHWIGPDGDIYNPGDKITVDASELYDGVTFDFFAVWEGKTISTQMTGYVTCLVPSTKDEKGEQNSEDYYKTYKSVKGKVKAVKDTETDKYTLYDNQTITIPKDAVPTKEGYVFKGWNTKRDGSGKTYQPGDAVPVALDKNNEDVEPVYLFAVFEKGSAANNGDTASPGSTDTNAPGTNNGDTVSPGTGDDFNAVPYVAAAIVSLGTIAGVVALKKKRDLADEAK